MLKNKFNKKVSVILTAMYIMCLNLSVGFAETNGYTDTENHWAGEAIEFVTEKGIMNGIGDGKFEPERKMTRGEFLAVAARTFRQTSGNTDDSNNLYADISKTQWNAPYIAALKANGCIPSEMISGGKLNPELPIIREEAAAIMWNCFYYAYKNEHGSEVGNIADADDISEWAREDVLKSIDAKIFGGDENNNFLPKQTITAAETAAVAYRVRTTDEAYVPDIPKESGNLIESETAAAYKRGAVRLVISPGTYNVTEGTPAFNGFRSHILLSDMEDFSFEGYDVNLIYQVVDCSGLVLQRCKNVTVKGFTTDYRITFFSQGEVIDVDGENGDFRLKIDDGYNNELDDPFWGATKTAYVYDPDTLKMAEGYSNVAFTVKKDTESNDDHMWRCHVTDLYNALQLKPGLLLAFRQGGSGVGMNTRVHLSSGTTLMDYTMCMGQMGLLEQNSMQVRDYKRTHLKNVKVTFGPTPTGATRRRLMSTLADGVHFTECQKGPLIEDCLIEGNGDDGIAIHGYFRMIMDKYNGEFPKLIGDYEDGKAFVIAGMWANERVLVGDRFSIYDSHGFKKASTRLAKPAVAVSGGDTTKTNTYYTTNKNVLGHQTLSAYSIYQFEDVMDLEYGDIIVDEDLTGDGYEVRNCSVIRNSTRGMLITANNGLIENCTVDGSRSGGIIVLPEIGWAQGGYTENLTIRNCTLKNIGSGYEGGLGIPRTASALNISSDVDGRNHKNIVIDNNRFESNWGYDIEIANTSGAVVKNNVFGSRAEAAKNLKHGESIFVENSDNVDIKSCNKGSGDRELYAASDCDNLKGLVPISVYPMTVTDTQDGIWRYQYSPLGTNLYYDYNFCDSVMDGFTPSFTWWVDSKWNSTFGGILNQSQVTTGSAADVTYTFVAPKDGRIEVTVNDGVRINPSSTKSDGVKFKIMKEDKNLYPKVGWQTVLYGDTGNVNEKVVTNIQKGERIYFRVNCLENTFYDNVVLSPYIKYLEENAQAETTECDDSENYTKINF